jgi:DNA-binding CsgD family transcriptional regulator
MKIKLLFSVLFFGWFCCSAQTALDSVQRELEYVLRTSQQFEQHKRRKIEAIKSNLRSEHTLEQRSDLLFQLIQEYRKYQIDSAIRYARQYKDIAERLKDSERTNRGAVLLVPLLSSAGKFIEAGNLLGQIRGNSLSATLLPDYFNAFIFFNSHYGQSSNTAYYFKQSKIYRDSLLFVLDSSSLDYKIVSATKCLYQNEVEKARNILQPLLSQTTEHQPERALIAYLMGAIYKNKGDVEKQLYYFSISAITDIKLAVKDNASLQSLALCYYETGDIDRAFTFIQQAIDDAMFSNMRVRTLKSSSFYTIINAAFQKKEAEQKQVLWKNLLIISTLTLLLVAVLLVLYKQIKKLKAARVDLHNTNHALQHLNKQLLQVNTDLSEANFIKEEYIAQFFDICSSYIDKIEEQRSVILKKFAQKQYDDISKMLKSQDFVRQEQENLYRNFDVIFLNLYPSFIEDFNGLLRPEERMHLNPGELNTELRIFALIRLGITDSAKIASFLRYSLRTVYNYRVKVRNKVAGSKDEFEDKIRNIGTIRSF